MVINMANTLRRQREANDKTTALGLAIRRFSRPSLFLPLAETKLGIVRKNNRGDKHAKMSIGPGSTIQKRGSAKFETARRSRQRPLNKRSAIWAD
jgi:hypothetical protein